MWFRRKTTRNYSWEYRVSIVQFCTHSKEFPKKNHHLPFHLVIGIFQPVSILIHPDSCTNRQTRPVDTQTSYIVDFIYYSMFFTCITYTVFVATFLAFNEYTAIGIIFLHLFLELWLFVPTFVLKHTNVIYSLNLY